MSAGVVGYAQSVPCAICVKCDARALDTLICWIFLAISLCDTFFYNFSTKLYLLDSIL